MRVYTTICDLCGKKLPEDLEEPALQMQIRERDNKGETVEWHLKVQILEGDGYRSPDLCDECATKLVKKYVAKLGF